MNIIKSIYTYYSLICKLSISWNENKHKKKKLTCHSPALTVCLRFLKSFYISTQPSICHKGLPQCHHLFEDSLGAYSPERNLRKSSWTKKYVAKKNKKKHLESQRTNHTHRLHVLGIFTLHEWLMFFMVHVGK